MELTNLNEEDILGIYGVKFQILKMNEEEGYLGSEFENYTEIYSHQFRSKSLHSAHLIEWHDDGRINFFKIKREKNYQGSQWLKARGGMFVFTIILI